MAQKESQREQNYAQNEVQPGREAGQGDGGVKRQKYAYMTNEPRMGQALGKKGDTFSGEGIVMQSQEFKYKTGPDQSPMVHKSVERPWTNN